MRGERSVGGLILIVIGVIFLGERMDWGLQWHMSRLWPLILVALGAMQIASRRLGAGFWLVFLGGIFLLNQNHILMLHDSWPLFIVAGGVGMLLRTGRKTRVPHE